MKYEDYKKELEEILKQFEKGELSIDESLEKYKKALSILDEMNKILEEAEVKLKEIQESNNV